MLDSQSITYTHLIRKAWPIILANASVPLLGLVDTAVIGNIGSVEDLGAIAFGALIFSFVYWSFGFLRMGTTGFTAQAAGAGDETEVRAVLGRALFMSVSLGILLILLQWPIRLIAFSLLGGTESVEILASDYFQIRIWGAPATLTNFALMGLLVGLSLSKSLLLVQLFLNTLNILLDVWFAAILELGVAGIALGTVLAEWMTVFLAGWLIFRKLRQSKRPTEAFWPKVRILDKSMLMKTLSANADIMIRTLLLVFSFAFFVNQSARFGDVLLAANHILLQIISFTAFFLDGYAFVVEALTGSAIGSKQLSRFDLAVQRSTVLALVTAIALAAMTWFWGEAAIGLLTDLTEVRLAAGSMLIFAVVYIICSFAAFQLDGVFIGASFTREMRNAAILSLLIFLFAWWFLERNFGINGLWWAMIIYVIARAGALLMYFPLLRRSVSSLN